MLHNDTINPVDFPQENEIAASNKPSNVPNHVNLLFIKLFSYTILESI